MSRQTPGHVDGIVTLTCDNGLGGRLDPNDFNLLTDLDNTLLNTPSDHGSPPLNTEHVLNRQGEWSVQSPCGVWNVVING